MASCRSFSGRFVALPSLVAIAACIPADDTPDLGSVEFVLGVSTAEQLVTVDGYLLRIDRVELGFKTMTIGKQGSPDLCAYRGRGATANVVFEAHAGATQTFNGIRPVECSDVGLILGPPDGATTVGPGARSADLLELATPPAAHAIIEATATPAPDLFKPARPPLRIKLRFDARAPTRFAGCGVSTATPARGLRITSGERDLVRVRFAAENLFRAGMSPVADLRIGPFILADELGNGDGTVTMGDLDGVPLADLENRDTGAFYELADGSHGGSLGDFVRQLFRFTIMFRTEDDYCLGIDPDR